VWARHFERTTAKPSSGGASGGARLRPVRDVGPGGRVESPYDADARFRTKRGANWALPHFRCSPVVT
jgi:transposase